MLGKHAAQKKDLKAAISHLIKLLRKSRQCAANQRAYLAEFLFNYQQFSDLDEKSAEEFTNQIPLPLIVDGSLFIQSRDSTLNSGSTNKDEISEESIKWATLEKDIVASYNLKHPKATINPSSSSKNESNSCVCSVGGIFCIN